MGKSHRLSKVNLEMLKKVEKISLYQYLLNKILPQKHLKLLQAKKKLKTLLKKFLEKKRSNISDKP